MIADVPLPYSQESEAAVLGCLLVEPNIRDTIFSQLAPTDFYLDVFRIIYECMRALYQKKEPIDLTTLTEELRAYPLPPFVFGDPRQDTFSYVGGQYRLLQLTESFSTAANVETYAQKLRELATLRAVVERSDQAKEIALRGDFDTLSAANGQYNLSAIIRQATATSDPIVAFGTFTLPLFPADALPTWLRAFVEAVSEQAETPLDLAGTLVLATVAAAVAGKANVSPSPGWQEPLNLFCLVALPPASRKSAVFKDVTRPLIEYERAENARRAPALAAAEAERDVLKLRLEEARKLAAKAKTDEARTIAQENVKELAQTLATMQVPGLLRLFADDVTLERLAGLMSEQQGRLAVLSAEGGIFGTLAGRYSEKSANLDVFLKGHAGDALRVDRVNRPPEYVGNPCLTLGLAVQPGVLHGLAKEPGFRDRGLLARFLYSLPESNIGNRPNRNPLISPAVAAAYHDGLLRLLTMETPEGEDGEPCPLSLSFAPDALSGLQAFRNLVETNLRPDGELACMQDWGGKLPGVVARLAGVLHLAEHGETSRTVSAATVSAAIALGKYFTEHAKAAFDLMGADPEIEDARHVLKWMERTRPTQFTRREAHRALQGRFKKLEPLTRALQILADRHYLRAVEAEERNGTGRRPSAVYEVNPALTY